MIRFITSTIGLLFVGILALAGLASPASATGGGDDDNKKVTFCHATGSATNPYVTLTTSVNAFYNAGHIGGGQPGTHSGDIYPSFTYTTKGGDVVTVPAQGDQSLLAFEDCQPPAEDEKIAKPSDTFADPCGTENDVFAVAPGRGYTVGAVTNEGSNQVITVSLNDGFTWDDDSTNDLRFVRPAFTDVDCDLPDTGIGATFDTTGGLVALGALVAGGAGLIFGGRRKVIA